MPREIGFGDKCGGGENEVVVLTIGTIEQWKVFEQNGDMMEVGYKDNLSSERELWSKKRDWEQASQLSKGSSRDEGIATQSHTSGDISKMKETWENMQNLGLEWETHGRHKGGYFPQLSEANIQQPTCKDLVSVLGFICDSS